MNKVHFATAAVLMLSSCANSAENIYIWLTGETQGLIKGDSTVTSLGRADTIEAVAYSHMLATEPDEKIGLPGTVRDHFPITIVKRMDQSSVRLFTAWRTHEMLSAVIRFYRPNPVGDGTTQKYYTVQLKGAYIFSIKQESLNNLIQANSNFPMMERIAIGYASITEQWMPDEYRDGDEWHAKQ
jgi:type VI secretion system secreted protein Hcp